MNKLERAKAALATSEERMQAALDALEAADDSIGDDELEALNREFDESEAEVARSKDTLAREERIASARAAHPAPAIHTGEEEPVYARNLETSFFADLMAARTQGKRDAYERLERNNRMVEEARKARGEARANADGSGFLPPVYLADQWVQVALPGRPFANAVPKMDLPPSGTAISYPVETTAATEAFHADGGNVDDTATQTTTRTSSLYAIAGQNEIDRLVLERSYPGMDMVIFSSLRRQYDKLVDSKLISGGGSGEFLGLQNVSSINTVDGSASTTQVEVLQDIYKGISKIASTRYMNADAILMHPRRAAWLASGFDSTFPVFNQGGLNAFQLGAQDNGFAGEIAGLGVIVDPNVPTNLGAGTNEDPIYLLVMDDLRLAEEGVQSASFQEVSSGTLAIRLQLWGFAAAIMDRYPKGICEITGLAAPTGF